MTLVASGGNGRLVDAYSILSAQTLACINRLEIALPSGEEIIADHAILIDALAAGERDQAAQGNQRPPQRGREPPHDADSRRPGTRVSPSDL